MSVNVLRICCCELVGDSELTVLHRGRRILHGTGDLVVVVGPHLQLPLTSRSDGRGRINWPHERVHSSGISTMSRPEKLDTFVDLLFLFPVLRSPVLEPDLDSCFIKFRGSGQIFPSIDVWVVGLLESVFKLLELFLGERCPMPSSCGSRRAPIKPRGKVT